MEKLINYKKQIIIIAILLIVIVIGSGIYILHTTLNNINYSKSEAHVAALKQFPGTIISSNHLLQPVAHLPYPLLHHEQLT